MDMEEYPDNPPIKKVSPRGIEYTIYRKPDNFVPVEGWPEGHKLHGINGRRCQAWSRQNNRQCNMQVMRGRDKCRKHGGTRYRGALSHLLTNGKYSQEIPERLIERYEAGLKDTELLSLNNEIALLDARIVDLLRKVDTGDSMRTWSALRTAHANLTIAVKTGDMELINDMERRIGGIIGDGYLEGNAWRELTKSLEQRRKLVESERKRLIEMQQTLTTQQAITLYTAIGIAIREESERLRKTVEFDLYGFLDGIQRRFNELMHRNAPTVSHPAEIESGNPETP